MSRLGSTLDIRESTNGDRSRKERRQSKRSYTKHSRPTHQSRPAYRMRRLKELERTFRHDPKRALGTDEDLRDVEPSGTLPRSTSSLDDLAVGENDGGVEEPFGFGGSVWTRRRNKAPRERMKKI
jgi:hypothetical protein